eukprot:3613651-Prymnesium_polylepis.1
MPSPTHGADESAGGACESIGRCGRHGACPRRAAGGATRGRGEAGGSEGGSRGRAWPSAGSAGAIGGEPKAGC